MRHPNLLGDHNTSPIVVNILLFSFQFKHFGPIFWVIRYFEIFFLSSRTNGNIFMLSQTFPRKEKRNHSFFFIICQGLKKTYYTKCELYQGVYMYVLCIDQTLVSPPRKTVGTLSLRGKQTTPVQIQNRHNEIVRYLSVCISLGPIISIHSGTITKIIFHHLVLQSKSQ